MGAFRANDKFQQQEASGRRNCRPTRPTDRPSSIEIKGQVTPFPPPHFNSRFLHPQLAAGDPVRPSPHGPEQIDLL